MDEKIPPQDLASEQSVLGSMMLSKEAIALAIGKMKPDYFYREAHAHIYEAIVKLYQKNEPVDLVTVSEQLKKAGVLADVGGRAYLAEVVDTVPTSTNVLRYAEIVFEKAILRKLLNAGSSIISEAFDVSSEASEALEHAQKVISDISREGTSDDFVHIKEVLNTVFDEMQSTYDNEDSLLGVTTGYPDLDEMTSGFQRGDLVILAARPSQGKTTLAMNMAAAAALEKQAGVAVFSCEMPKEQLAMRLLCAEARIDSSRLRTANLQDHEYKDLNRAFGRLAEAPIFIDDTPGITPLDLRAKVRRLQTETEIKLILIDYLQLMKGGKKRIESRFQEVSEIVKDVKAFAKESGIPIIALAQLSRDLEKRQDKRPMLSDLRESGEIEQTADLILFIYKDEAYENPNPAILNIQLIVSKHRNGPTGHIDLVFKKDISRFMSAAPAQPAPAVAAQEI